MDRKYDQLERAVTPALRGARSIREPAMPLELLIIDLYTEEPFRGSSVPVIAVDDLSDTQLKARIAEDLHAPDCAFVRRRSDAAWRLETLTPGGSTPFSTRGVIGAFAAIGVWTRASPSQITVEADDAAVEGEVQDGTVSCRMPGRVFRDGEPLAEMICDELAETLDLLSPDAQRLVALNDEGIRGVAVTTTAGNALGDFALRYFAPGIGLPEDAFTASMHVAAAKYWADTQRRSTFRGTQLSSRGGSAKLRLAPDAVEIECNASVAVRGAVEG
jgi:predicted PhzF superfamily epimerase YddE/YHI9